MPTYFPPKKGLDPTPQVGAPAIGGRLDGPDATSTDAQAVIDRNAGTIQAWLAAQRNAVANSITNIHSARLDHPEIEATYQNHYGAETVTLSPKVVPQAGPTSSVPAPGPPNDLPELARTDEVGPQTPLYLMVLYGTDEIAAVPMDGLANPSVFYAGQSDKTTWSTAGGPLPTLQAKLGGTEFVMLPLDITGTVAVTTLWLMTNALGDAVATGAPLTDTPLFNGTAASLYTIGGAYSYAKGAFKKTAAFDSTLAPTAIGPDGTCIYQPQVAGSCGVQVDLASPALDAAISATIASVALDLPSTNLYDAVCLENYIQRTETQGASGGTFDTQVVSLHTTVDIITIGPYAQKGSISGYSCWGSAAFGQQPIVQNFIYSVEGGSALTFVAGQYEIANLTDGNTDISNSLPMTSYTTSGSLDIIDVPVTALQKRSETMTFDMSKTPAAQTATLTSADYVYNGNNGEPPGSSSYVSYVQDQYCYGVPSTVTKPVAPYTQASVDAYYAAGVAAVMALNGSDDESHAVPVVSLTSTFFAPPTISAPLSAIPAGQPADNYQGLSGAYAGPGVTGIETYAGYASLGLPVTYPTIGTETIKATAFVLGQPLEWDYSTGGSKDTQPSLTLFHFPPLLDGKGFMSLSTEQSATVITPYDTYQNTAQADFIPWLHVSNGSHCIQGYAVNGTLHAYLDGGTTDWLPALAKALGCKVAEIVTMVMDVTLDKIQAVAHVKGQSYDATASGSSAQA